MNIMWCKTQMAQKSDREMGGGGGGAELLNRDPRREEKKGVLGGGGRDSLTLELEKEGDLISCRTLSLAPNLVFVTQTHF